MGQKRNLLLLVSLMLLLFVCAAAAQEAKVEGPEAPVADTRGSMLREIGLTADQIREVRRLNMDRKPLMQAAQARLREASRLLDEAIYGDEVNDAEVQSRLKEAQSAQAEVLRIRASNELAIRKILSQAQLIKFRELRRRFEEQARQNMQMRRRQNRMDQSVDTVPGSVVRRGARLRPMLRRKQQ